MSDDKTIVADAAGMSIMTSSPRRMRACLVQYNGQNLGKRFPLDLTQMILGRSPRVSIVVNDKSVSRIHAQAYRNGTRIDLEDLDSVNGTFINDLKIEQRKILKDGDFIRLGTVLFKYFAHDNIESIFHDKIYRMSTIDAGTSTFNKKYLMETLESEFKYSKSYNQPLSIIYFDLDFFKKVNDTYGHSTGDYVLKETANLISTLLGKDDILCRYGGEEFVIIQPGTDKKNSMELAEKIRLSMENNVFNYDNKEIRQNISAGVSQRTNEMDNLTELLNDADQKLYYSKSHGRNKVTY